MEAVWKDEDDIKSQNIIAKSSKAKKRFGKSNKDNESENVQNALESKYRDIKQYTNKYTWANIEESTEDNDDNLLSNLLKTSQSITTTEKQLNADNNRKIKLNHSYKVKALNGYIAKPDLNQGHSHKSILTDVEFSPTNESIAFTAGLDKTLKIFSLNLLNDDTNNEESGNSRLLSTVKTNDLAIHSAKFLNSNEIIMSGRKKHFFSYDLEKEKLVRNILNVSLIKSNSEIKSLERLYTRHNSDTFAFTTLEGDIFLFDSKSRQFKSSLKINGSVNSVVPNSHNKNYVYCCSNQGEIFIFDIRRTNSCVNKLDDQGSFNTLCIDIDMNNEYFASSLSTGVVNLYNLESINYASGPKIEPIKVSIKI